MRLPAPVPAALVALVALAAAWLAWTLKPSPTPTYREIVVHDTLMLAQRPDTVLRLVDRIVWRVAEPVVVARGDSSVPARLEPYCGPAAPPPPDSGATAPAVLPPSSGKYDGTRLSLFSVTSDGRLFAQETEVGSPFEWVDRGDRYEVREKRAGFRLLRGLPGDLTKIAAGVLVGLLVAQ